MIDNIEDIVQSLTIDYFLPYQIKWINDPCQISIRDKSRRTGGTQTVAFESLLWAFETKMKDRDIWFTSADKKAAEEFIRAVTMWSKIFNLTAELIDEPLIKPEDKQEDFYLKYEVRIPLGDDDLIRVNALSSNINSFHGKQGFMIVDEMARHKDQISVWEGAFPATIWGYPLRVISTQNGRGLFYQLTEACKKGKHPDWGYHHVDIHEAIADGLYDKVAIGMGLIQPGEHTTNEQQQAWIDQLKRSCLTESVWNQQFLCIAEDENTAFLPYALIYPCQAPEVLIIQNDIPRVWNGKKENIIYGPEDLKSKWVIEAIAKFKKWFLQQVFTELFIGVDIGRTKHLTVIWITDKIVKIKFTRFLFELAEMPFWVQKEFLRAILQHPAVRRCRIDETGLGKNLAEDLQFDYSILVEPVNFSAKVKEMMAYRFKAAFEDKTIVIPEDDILAADLHMPKKETTANGNIRFVVENELDEDGKEIGHADRFWAGALMETGDGINNGPVVVASRGRRESSNILKGY